MGVELILGAKQDKLEVIEVVKELGFKCEEINPLKRITFFPFFRLDGLTLQIYKNPCYFRDVPEIRTEIELDNDANVDDYPEISPISFYILLRLYRRFPDMQSRATFLHNPSQIIPLAEFFNPYPAQH